MSKRFETSIDLNKNELQNPRFQNLSGNPSSPVEGQFYWHTVDKKVYTWNGSAWVGLGAMTAAEILALLITVDGVGSNLDSDLLDGQSSAYYLARANHTGTQAIATIAAAATARLFGRATAAAGPGEEISLGADLSFTGTTLQTNAFTGDVTKAAGGVATTIAADAVSNTKLANMAANSIKGNNTGGSADPADLTAAQVKTLLAIANTDVSGLGALATKSTIASADITDGTVANADLANMATQTIKGRITAATGVPEDLTAAQAKTILAIVPGDVTGFDTQVRTSRLDQMAAPTADVSLNSRKITNLTDPAGAQDAATKNYVDSVAQGLDVKASVRAASTGNLNIASPGATIDGVSMVANDRFLAKDQSTGSQNGIYVWNGAAVAATRSLDADTSAEVTPGMFVFVEQGTVNADSGWTLTTDAPITLATTALVFAQFSGAGQITAGNGLTKTGNTLDVGAGAGITVAADTVAVNTAVVVTKYAQDIGDGSSVAIVVTHNLNTRDIAVGVRNNSTPWEFLECDVEATSVNTCTLRFATAPASAAYRVIIHA